MTALIEKPGIWHITREQYDADPCPAPSLSNSIAKLLYDYSPAHAWLRHPRLNPNFEREDSRKFDLGNAAHALMLGEGGKVVTIAADDFKTKAAREARDDAIAAGHLPLLTHVYDQACEMVASARRQLKLCEEGQGAFDPAIGVSEQTVVWLEGETWCRARPDWLPRGGGNICWDYKTTGESANPERWVRTMFNVGGDSQPAFYLRGLRVVTQREWHWRWLVQEIEPPYAISICEPSQPMIELGEYKVQRALALWQRCLAKNFWPGYSRRTHCLEVVPWEEKKILDAIERRAVSREIDADELAQAIALYAPDKDKAA